ncbi:MAG TPA: hypothetical protein VGB51_08535 [Actinomycetota bacterium]
MKRLSIPSLIAASLIIGAQTAGAATSVSISTASRSGDTLTVTGTSTFDDQPFVQMGTDPANDATTPAPAGQDLTAAAVRMKANGQLEFRWTVSLLPPAANGVPTFFYGWTFCSTEETCFELDAGRFYNSPADGGFSGFVWACADAACDIASQGATSIPVSVAVAGPATGPNTISASVSASALSATPGSTLTPVMLSPYGPAFTAVYDSYASGNVFPDVGDGVAFDQGFPVAGKNVSLAVGAPGQDPATVAYTSTATVSPTGAFSGGVNVADLTGDQTIYARACLGTNNCAYQTAPVTL